jgi:hypothetical protein
MWGRLGIYLRDPAGHAPVRGRDSPAHIDKQIAGIGIYPSNILNASAAEMRLCGWNRISPWIMGRRGLKLGSLTCFLNFSTNSGGRCPWSSALLC